MNKSQPSTCGEGLYGRLHLDGFGDWVSCSKCGAFIKK